MSDALAISVDESRFDRQERITWWDQDLLRHAKVVVVGAGALGNEIVKNLVLVGVGHILVVDFDTVEMSNLSRCVFFRPEDEGLAKALALAERAGEISPESVITGLTRDIRTFGTGLAFRADVLVGGLDSREARLCVNRLAWRVGRPWVDGAMEALTGVARVFRPPDSCYECTLTATDFEIMSHRQSCRLLSRDDLLSGKVPTTATTSSVIAGLQVQEVVKLLHEQQNGARPVDGGYVVDGANNDSYVIRYPFGINCMAHETMDDPVAVEAATATTFADLAAAVDLTEAVVDLGDDYLVAWDCTSCSTTAEGRGLVAVLGFGEAECPDCGEPRQPVTVSSIEVPGSWSDETLDDFGLKVDEVVGVRSDSEQYYVWARRTDPDLPGGW